MKADEIGDRLRVVELEPARLPGAGELRRKVGEELLLFAGSEMHQEAPFRTGCPPAGPCLSICTEHDAE